MPTFKEALTAFHNIYKTHQNRRLGQELVRKLSGNGTTVPQIGIIYGKKQPCRVNAFKTLLPYLSHGYDSVLCLSNNPGYIALAEARGGAVTYSEQPGLGWYSLGMAGECRTTLLSRILNRQPSRCCVHLALLTNVSGDGEQNSSMDWVSTQWGWLQKEQKKVLALFDLPKYDTLFARWEEDEHGDNADPAGRTHIHEKCPLVLSCQNLSSVPCSVWPRVSWVLACDTTRGLQREVARAFARLPRCAKGPETILKLIESQSKKLNDKADQATKGYPVVLSRSSGHKKEARAKLTRLRHIKGS